MSRSVEEEVRFFQEKVNVAKEQIKEIQAQSREGLGEEHAKIFDAHLEVLEDPAIIDETVSKIETEQVSATYALDEIAKEFIAIFEAMDDEYLRERAHDVADVTERVLRLLLGMESVDLSTIAPGSIIIAKDLTPSETAQLDREKVNGFVTDLGGRTSHSAIMARALGIPAIVGTKTVTEEVNHGQTVAIDGQAGDVFVEPGQETLNRIQTLADESKKKAAELAKWKNEKSETKDGN
nr:PEP-utilizing enzyme [uncultured Allobacillus sp.]